MATSKLREHARRLRRHRHLPELPYQHPPGDPAHILPITKGGEHRLDNGLRSDVHTMFDQGYLAVDTRYRLQVSPRLRSDFGNGEQYYAKAGQPIDLPEHRVDRPDHDFLQWHLEEVFNAS